MAYMPGLSGAPTLYMAIRAKDETRGAFQSVSARAQRLGSTAITTARRIGTLAMRFATLGRVTGLLNDEQARAIGIFGTVISTMMMVADVVKILTAIDWAHVTALTWKMSLMTLGVGVAIAAAAAFAVLSMQTRNAADAQREYNQELETGVRAQDRYASRQQSMVRRGQFEEVL